MSPTEKREAAFQREMSKPCAVRNLSDVFMAGVACGKAEIEGTIPMTTPKTPEGWQPIETAPKDKGCFLGWVEGTVRFIQWGKTSHVPLYGWNLADQGVEEFDLCHPTHWMPLPAAPGAPAAPSAEGVGSGGVAPSDEPFWYVVVSDETPVISKAIRRADVAEEYAQKCRADGYRVDVVPLYRAPTIKAADAQAGTADMLCNYPGCECDGPAPDGGCASPMRYTDAIGRAGEDYRRQFTHAYPLPAQWRWQELWERMCTAAGKHKGGDAVAQARAAKELPTAPAGGEAPTNLTDEQIDAIQREWINQGGSGPRGFARAVEAKVRALLAIPLYTHPSADLRGAAEQALKAMANYRVAVSYMDLSMKDGINVQGAMSDLLGAEDMLDVAIASLEAAISRKGKTE